MYTRQQLRSRLFLAGEDGDPMMVALALGRVVRRPAIGVDQAASVNAVLDKRHQTLGRGVGNTAHADPSDPSTIFLSGNDYQSLALGLPPSHPLLQSTHIGLIHLDAAGQAITPDTDHGSP